MQETDLVDAEGDDPANWKQVSGGAVSRELLNDLLLLGAQSGC